MNDGEFGAAPGLPKASTPEVSPRVRSILFSSHSPLLLPTHGDLNEQNPEFLATVAPSFLVTKVSLLSLGVKSISEMKMVQAQESACEGGEGLGRKGSQGPIDGRPVPPAPTLSHHMGSECS